MVTKVSTMAEFNPTASEEPESVRDMVPWNKEDWDKIAVYRVKLTDKQDCLDYLTALVMKSPKLTVKQHFVIASNICFGADLNPTKYPLAHLDQLELPEVAYSRVYEDELTVDQIVKMIKSDDHNFWTQLCQMQLIQLQTYCGVHANTVMRLSQQSAEAVHSRFSRSSGNFYSGLKVWCREIWGPLDPVPISKQYLHRLRGSFKKPSVYVFSWIKSLILIRNVNELIDATDWALLKSAFMFGFGMVKYYSELSHRLRDDSCWADCFARLPDNAKNEFWYQQRVIKMVNDIYAIKEEWSYAVFYCKLFSAKYFGKTSMYHHPMTSSFFLTLCINYSVIKDWPLTFPKKKALPELVKLAQDFWEEREVLQLCFGPV
jgi:hypothetical protein